MKVPFNRPVYLKEHQKVFDNLVNPKKLSGDGASAARCELELEKQIGSKILLVPSATAALEMMALLLDIKEGDEVIVPSYTFVTSASAFSLRNATIKFADIDQNGNILPSEVERLYTSKTKAVCAVHYASHSCNMTELQKICKDKNIYLLEDAAQCINSQFQNKSLGSLGSLGCISFHDTKNITSGEGGALIINDEKFFDRAEIIRDKGTNRKSFQRGEINKYSWLDLGSSFCFSELNALYLEPQIAQLNQITSRRKKIWEVYNTELSKKFSDKGFRTLSSPDYNQSNYHMFASIAPNQEIRDKIYNELNQKGIQATLHYQPLHLSKYGSRYPSSHLPNTEKFANCITRLPLWYNLTDEQINLVISETKDILSKI